MPAWTVGPTGSDVRLPSAKPRVPAFARLRRASRVPSPSPEPESRAPSPGLVFTDVTAAAGIRFRHNNGAFGKKYLPETLGSGCAFLDFDGDGWQDILLVNSKNFPGRPGPPSYPALYRNNRNGTFTDVTKQAGLAVEIYGFGVSAADYDNDGRVDIYITALGPNRLFKNVGGRFVDVSERAGVNDPGFSTSAMWFDYDRDGKLDLFVANYVEWSADRDLFCTLDGKSEVVLHAGVLQGAELDPLPEQGGRDVRERDQGIRPLRSLVESIGRRAHRLQPGRPAGSVRRERHAAEPAVSEQGERHVRRRRDDGRRGVQRGRRRTRRHGRRCRGLTTDPAGRAWSSATSRTR